MKRGGGGGVSVCIALRDYYMISGAVFCEYKLF